MVGGGGVWRGAELAGWAWLAMYDCRMGEGTPRLRLLDIWLQQMERLGLAFECCAVPVGAIRGGRVGALEEIEDGLLG